MDLDDPISTLKISIVRYVWRLLCFYPPTPYLHHCNKLTTGEFSDITIKYGEKTFDVHKVIVCGPFPVLHGAFKYFQGKISRHGTMFSLFGSTLTSKPRSQTPVSLTSLKMTIPNLSRFRSMSCTTSTMKCRAQSKTSLTSCCFTRDFSSLPISTTTPYWVSCYLQDQACIWTSSRRPERWAPVQY